MPRMISALLLALALASSADAEETRSIKVTAVSEVKVVPDEVVMSFTVDSEAEGLLEAKKKNDEITEKVFALAPQFSIKRSDMKVTDLDLNADEYGFGDKQQHVCERSLEVRLTDFKQIEPFLAALITAGVERLHSMEFRVSDQRQHQTEARKLAMDYAREKATHLTELTNMTLGSPIRIEENEVHNPYVGGFAVRLGRRGAVFGGRGGGFGLKSPSDIQQNIVAPRSSVVLTSLQQDDGKLKDELIGPGQIAIAASVTVEFEMRKE